MIYTATSMQEVFARIVRNTRLQDASFLKDMEEWIPEAMGYMKTRMALESRFKDVTIRFHKGSIPCGLQALQAVEYRGCRLRYYNGARSAGSIPSSTSTANSVYPGIPQEGTTLFNQQIVTRPAVDDGEDVNFFETDIRRACTLPFHGEHWYYAELGYVNTSFCDGCVRVHYRGIPLDDAGLPLIPDDELYKEALYWYARAKMIGAGYPDKQFSEATCMDRFEQYAGKAMARIRYPSVDQKEAAVAKLTRLVLPDNYWESYFNPSNENIGW